MSALPPIATTKADISSEIALLARAKSYAQVRGITLDYEERILFAVGLPPPRPCSMVRSATLERDLSDVAECPLYPQKRTSLCRLLNHLVGGV
jgi:hypothetical protein